MSLAKVLIIFICLILSACSASADTDTLAELTDNNLSDVYDVPSVDSTDFSTGHTTEGVRFDLTEVHTSDFEISTNEANNSITIEAINEPDITSQTIGIPISAISDEPGQFTDNVLVTHYNDLGVVDWTKVEDPYVIGSTAFVDVEFSTVTITPLISNVAGWSFEDWSAGTSNAAPTGWTAGSSGVSGVSRASGGKFGDYALSLSGSGWIKQSIPVNIWGYYTVGCWVKNNNLTAGSVVIDLVNGNPSIDSTGIDRAYYTVPSRWTWCETREYIHSDVPDLRIWVWNPTGAVLFDGVMLSPDFSFTASESTTSNTITQDFSYTPTGVYNSSTFMSRLSSYNASTMILTGTSVAVDGFVRNSWSDADKVFFDTSGLSAAAHSVNITANYIDARANGLYGIVYDTNKNIRPIKGAVITLRNETWSETYVTGADGFYTIPFTLNSGTYTMSVSATGYQTTPVEMPFNATAAYIEKNIALTKNPSYFAPHNVEFVVMDKSLKTISGANISVYEEGNAPENGQPDFTGLTGSLDGGVTFQLSEDVQYTVITTYGSATDTETVYPLSSNYKIILNINSNTVPVQLQDTVSYNITHSNVTNGAATITATYTDTGAATSNVQFIIGQKSGNGSFVPLNLAGTKDTWSGAEFVSNKAYTTWSLNNVIGQTYIIKIVPTHNTFGTIEEIRSVGFWGSKIPFIGTQIMACAGIFFWLLVSAMFGRFQARVSPLISTILFATMAGLGVFSWFNTVIENANILMAGTIGVAFVFSLMVAMKEKTGDE